ncbi:MFS transporter, DHA2 family, methyl viologen resistance protein SmvA [Actinoplanes sp. SE50]|uniref:MFS transporter n=1 Tax=unclassified Actinoplanes TaxID=2626549 RepID=UPI00023EC15F|nr:MULTISPECIES: MFS transporter [unclassified Actinoplanes]AEV86946.1 MFS transporter, DHA2 family, methyl viologen resistance protein SmvA [Actinoplanes sp. SE50/110]ATO85342.1 MFS transporter, DHA2 family, methyl viologen resistance protein SmvA [Actinoplanes sp. SE50]SLM02753.1 MFS transporter DHA2 family, methyl viologen resistance protein SmvA [Actinoplanes sp. SE50/110]
MTQIKRQAGRREWIALAVLSIPPLLVSMDITVLYFAIPQITNDLRPTTTQQLWMIDIYGFLLAGMLIALGDLADRLGRRTLLLLGLAVFGLASLGASFANSPETLIVARAVQGIGAAALMPAGLALLRNLFEDDGQRRTAITIWSIGVASGAGIGPVISGVLLHNFWWGSVFLVNVPIIAVALILTAVLVPNFKVAPGSMGRFDFFGALLSLVAVLAIIWGVKEGAINGFHAKPLTALIGGLVAAALFLYRQTHLTHPMIDPKLFRTKGFTPVLVLSLTGFFCVIGFGVFSTQWLMEVKGLGPLQAGLWMMASPLLAGGIVPVATGMVNKVRPAYLITGGFVLATIGYVIMSQVKADSPILLVVSGTVCIGIGTASIFALLTDMVIAVAPVDQTAAVSALSKTMQELGGALGIAIFGTVGASVYRHYFDAHLPSGLPADVVAGARQTMGAASGIAASLPDQVAKPLLEVARIGFSNSLATTAVVGIAVAAGSALLTVTRLRHVRYTTEEVAAKATAEPAEAEIAPVA